MDEPFVCIKCGRRSTSPPDDNRCLKCGGEVVGEYSLHKASQFMFSTEDLEDLPPEVERAYKNPNNIFGRYVLIRLVGRGGAADVFRAWHTSLRKYVAVKRSHTVNPDAIMRLQREARNASRLTHPNIVPIHDMGFVEIAGVKWYYISMDYIPGVPLTRADFPLDAKVRMIRDIALALDYAHEKRIVHRDIKPGNILVDRKGAAFLTDFGLARQVDDPRLTVTEVIVGTPVYMSPEQAQGWTPAIDARSDVYSLGATLYEVLTGVPPFSGDNSYEVINNVVKLEPIPPRSIQENIDPRLDAICLRAMEKDRGKRFQSAKELGEELTRYLQGASRSPGLFFYRALRDLRRTAGAALLLLLLAGLFGSATFFMWHLMTPESRPGTSTTSPPPVDGPDFTRLETLERAAEAVRRYDALTHGPLREPAVGKKILDGAGGLLATLRQDPQVAYQMGCVRRREEKFGEAVSLLDSAILKRPLGRVFSERARVRADQVLCALVPHRPGLTRYPGPKRVDLAKAAWRDILEARKKGYASEEEVVYYVALGQVAERRYADAIRALEGVLKHSEDDVALSLRARTLLADALLVARRPTEAIRHYRTILGALPGDIRIVARTLQAWARHLDTIPIPSRRREELRAASRLTIDAVQAGRTNTNIELWRGTLLTLVGETRMERQEESIEDLRNGLASLQGVVKREALNGEVHYRLSRAHFLLSQHHAQAAEDPSDQIARAMHHCKQAQQLDTRNTRARALLAEIIEFKNLLESQ